MKTKFKDLEIKEKIAIITAIAAFLVGWGLSIAGFIVPPIGEVADSILWILGQSLIYAASVFGITGYFNSEVLKLRSERIDLRHEIDRRFKHLENMQDEKDENENEQQ